MQIRISSILLALGCLVIGNREVAAATVAAQPQYCDGFTEAACTRMQSVVESQKLPIYCGPGFGLTTNPVKLSDEQLRLCYVMTDAHPSQAEQDQAAAIEHQRNQQIADARSMVQNEWATGVKQIGAVELAYKCGVADQWTASLAVQRVQIRMRDELNQAGLAGDPTMDLKSWSDQALQAGKQAAETHGCDHLSDSTRGQLRALVSTLTR